MRVRPAVGSDLGTLARFMARLNADPTTRCLHAGGGSAEVAVVRAGLREIFEGGGMEGSFVLAERAVADGELVGALGCRRSGRTGGWLWGPLVGGEAAVEHDAIARALFDGFEEHTWSAGGGELRAFLDENNVRGLRFLRDRGFRSGQRTHVFIAPRQTVAGATSCGELRPMHAAGFARLHEATFPTSEAEGSDAATLLAERDDAERQIFAATDGGLRLLGYVCASVHAAPREGFIDYLAVKEIARGRGLGGELLRAAQRWFFDDLGLPRASLCVSEWRAGQGGARRVYEREGFALRHTGIAARRG